jgi:hypothetical protein
MGGGMVRGTYEELQVIRQPGHGHLPIDPRIQIVLPRKLDFEA